MARLDDAAAARSAGPAPRADSAAGPHMEAAPLPDQPDLASRWLGSSVVAASDESFGDKEALLQTERAAFEPGHYGNRGEIVDGWETRRRREPGNDWAIVRLGSPGRITAVDVDTSFFTGNFPEFVSVEACGCEGYPSPAELIGPKARWTEIIPRSPLRGDIHNTFRVTDERRFTHVRLNTYPDGGVARLRVYGKVIPDPRQLDRVSVDLASQEHGGWVVASSDEFYSTAQRLNRPDAARSMGEGWETRRRRDAGNDFVVIRLAFAGVVQQLIIDTAHFKYNASAEVAVQCSDKEPPPSEMSPVWEPFLPKTRLQPDTRHILTMAVPKVAAAVRVDAFPDGGLSRVRVIGRPTPTARRRAGYGWFNSLPNEQAIACLRDASLDESTALRVVGQRPLSDGWLDEQRGRGSAQESLRLDGKQVALVAALLEGPNTEER